MNQMEVIADGRPWRDYLSDLIVHGVKLGLSNIQELLARSGDPQKHLACIHIAGTNGKGSVAAFLDAVFRAAGYRVGKFTSPHLIDITERFQINGEPIEEDAFREQVEWFRGLAATMEPSPTFFEMNTAIAFRWFALGKVDVALMEVGMGGRFDATNVLEHPVVSAITSIDLDHTQYLGDTLGAIAFEKAGILKAGVPCVVGPCDFEALSVIRTRAREVGAPLFIAGEGYRYRVAPPPGRPHFAYSSDHGVLEGVELALSGMHQGANAAVAAGAAFQAASAFPKITPAVIAEGLATAQWPCRLEQVLEHPPVIIDVAHNPAGAKAIAGAAEGAIVVMAVSSDKDVDGILSVLAPPSSRLILTAFTGGRSMDVSRLDRLAEAYPHETAPDLETAIDRAVGYAAGVDRVLIAGSVYAAGEARRILMEKYAAARLRF